MSQDNWSAGKRQLEASWQSPQTIEAYEGGRAMFRTATARVVSIVMDKYMRPDTRALEIGSGLGKLVETVPQYTDQIQQTEQSVAVVRRNRELHPGSNVQEVNVYTLPYPDASYDLAVGYASVDTLASPEVAMREIGRVLRPGGEFVHILDLQASSNTVFHELREQGDIRIPFPAHDGKGHVTGIRLLAQQELAGVKASLPPVARPLLDVYAQDPEVMFGKMTDAHPDTLLLLAQMTQQFAGGAQVIDFNEYFFERMTHALEATGFKIVEFGRREASVDEPRDVRDQKVPAHVNAIVKDVGLITGINDPVVAKEMQPSEIRTTSRLHIIVARKVA